LFTTSCNYRTIKNDSSSLLTGLISMVNVNGGKYGWQIGKTIHYLPCMKKHLLISHYCRHILHINSCNMVVNTFHVQSQTHSPNNPWSTQWSLLFKAHINNFVQERDGGMKIGSNMHCCLGSLKGVELDHRHFGYTVVHDRASWKTLLTTW
jgi:hypothetical protein